MRCCRLVDSFGSLMSSDSPPRRRAHGGSAEKKTISPLKVGGFLLLWQDSLQCTVVTSCFLGKILCEPLRPLRWKGQSTAEGAEERRDFGCGQKRTSCTLITLPRLLG
jgi:hypothetical protein